MEKTLSSFTDFLYEEKKLSENTLLSYRRDLNLYSEYLVSKKKDYINVDSKDIAKYIEHLKKTGKAVSTVSRNIASIRAFYLYLLKEGKIDINPAQDIKYEKKT